MNDEAAEKARSIKHLDQKRHAINQLAGRASEGSTPAAATTCSRKTGLRARL